MQFNIYKVPVSDFVWWFNLLISYDREHFPIRTSQEMPQSIGRRPCKVLMFKGRDSDEISIDIVYGISEEYLLPDRIYALRSESYNTFNTSITRMFFRTANNPNVHLISVISDLMNDYGNEDGDSFLTILRSNIIEYISTGMEPKAALELCLL